MIIGIDASRAFVNDRTGTEEYSYNVIKEMVRLPASRKHQFVLFTRPNAILPQWSARENITIVPIKFRYLWTQVGLAMYTWKSYASKFSKFSEAGEENTGNLENRETVLLPLDVLWVPAHTLPVLRRPDLKTVVTIHGLEYKWLQEYDNILQRWYLPLSTFYAAKSATKLICVSENTKRDLAKEVYFDTEKAVVIWEGVDLIGRVLPGKASQKGLSLLRKWGIHAEKYLLFVGSLQPRKNLVALIRAFEIFSRVNSSYKLVIAGGLGWDYEEIFQEVVRQDVSEKVVFTGRVSEREKQALYQNVDIYVQPSVTEGFGLPVLEAMAYGVPSVVSSGGALEEVADGAGLVVELGNGFEDNLAKAMKRLSRDTKLRKKLQSNGYERVGELTWKRAAELSLKCLINA